MTPAPAWIAILAALLLALPTALAKEEPAEPSSYGSIDGVTYLMLAGAFNASAMASDSGGGDRPVPFSGCAFVQLRPGLERGRVSVAGLVDGFTPMRLEVGDFGGDLDGQGAIATNLTVGGVRHPTAPAGASVRAEAAAEGVAEMKAAEYIDETRIPPSFALANFTDPVSGSDELRAVLVAAQDGVRDDATGALQGQVARDDGELHIVLTSAAGAAPQGDAYRFDSPGDLPDGSHSADAEHSRTFEFLNTRFGGKAAVTFSASSKAPPGFNAVTVAVRAPDGSEAGNASVEWSALAAGAATVEFPADQMGFYDVVVTGKLMLATYALDVRLDPAPKFQLDLWWEDVIRGSHAVGAYGDCQRDIGLRAQVVAGRVDRAEPPAFPLRVVILAVVAGVTAALLVVKMVSDQVSSGAFRKLKR